MISITALLEQEKKLRCQFYTANYNNDKAAIKIALKKLESVLSQEYNAHLLMQKEVVQISGVH